MLVAALTACSSNSTRPTVTCDRTPPTATLPPLPSLSNAAGLVAMDEWIANAIGIYTREITIRRGEHACMDKLRTGGVIQ